MKLKYKINGMSCQGCVAKVSTALSNIAEVSYVEVDKSTDTATLEMTEEVPIQKLEKALKDIDAKYSIDPLEEHIKDGTTSSWLTTYRPLLLVFFYILLVTGLVQYVGGGFDLKSWMTHFMAAFFLVFSFFKLLDLSGFADSYSGYDLIAKRWPNWSYVYAFIELGLGIAYLIDCCPLATNIVAFLVMTISIIGVLQSVWKKQKIQCACLGAIFDLPMSTVTIIEDAIMIIMSGFMITQLI